MNIRVKGCSLLLAAMCTAVASAPAQSAGPILWRNPGNIAALDLRWGSGSAARAPRPPFRFVRENPGGTTLKVVVTDAQGNDWDVKIGVESHAEVAANRIVWALGYGAEARWTFGDNPFKGSKELSGLAILMTLVNNRDIAGPRNNRILNIHNRSGAETWYEVQDLGASFGRFNDHSPIKWNPAEFARNPLMHPLKEIVSHSDIKDTTRMFPAKFRSNMPAGSRGSRAS